MGNARRAKTQPLGENRLLWWVAALLVAAGLSYLLWGSLGATASPPTDAAVSAPVQVDRLEPGVRASMESTPFTYSRGWAVDATGADPAEPADPWSEPSGRVTFSYTGRELTLALATGDYWGYIFVTVDGMPANLLPVIPGNGNSLGDRAGYKPLYAPERQGTDGPSVEWLLVHRAADPDAAHEVMVEVWRAWGQTPLRGVAVDGLPPSPQPIWPGAALLLAALCCAGAALARSRPARLRPNRPLFPGIGRLIRWSHLPAVAGFAAAIAGVAMELWWLTAGGLIVLAVAALLRPIYWPAALLAALPFYFAVNLPLLPGRSVGLIDVGALGGLAILAGHWLLRLAPWGLPTAPHGAQTGQAALRQSPGFGHPILWAVLLAGWALVATMAAARPAQALYEWRTVFLAGAAFGLTLWGAIRVDARPAGAMRLLLVGWTAGATVVAGIALWQFGADRMIITAEGVRRVRGLYGSPNNLALYLDRTLPVVLAVAVFGRGRVRIWAGAAAVIQAAALLLTFSKGALLLGLPAALATLWIGGFYLLGRRGVSRRPLWWLAGAAGAVLLALTPFLGTERFRNLLDLSQGTGFLRLQLWRSAWQMALDHPWLGVGPDNFLYAYRSGYILPAAWQEPNLNHPHNWFLDWWTRLGLVGLALGLAFWASGLWRLIRGLVVRPHPATPDPNGEAVGLGLLAAAAAALAHGLIDVSYALPDLMLIWLLLFCIRPVTGAWERATVGEDDPMRAATAAGAQ